MIRVYSSRILFMFSIAAATGCSYMNKGPVMETGFVVRDYDSSINGAHRKYGLFIPQDYNHMKRKKWPMILFLHGFGESGENTDLLLKHGPIKEALFRPDFQFIVVAPQHPSFKKPAMPEIRKGWMQQEPDVMKMLEEVKSTYRVDTNRIYITGLSMGGFGTFDYVASHPGMFAAAAPICGGGDPAMAKDYIKTPFWIFHGQKDPTVPVRFSTEIHDIMKALGGDVKITLYPEAQHDSWTETYQKGEVFKWFLSHDMKKDKELAVKSAKSANEESEEKK